MILVSNLRSLSRGSDNTEGKIAKKQKLTPPKCNGPPDTNGVMFIMISFSFVRHTMPFRNGFQLKPMYESCDTAKEI